MDNAFTVNIDKNKVLYTSISTNSDGYNYASIAMKEADNEYINISYEWRSSGIPGFVMDLMEFMKKNNVETSGIWPGKENEYKELAKTDVNV